MPILSHYFAGAASAIVILAAIPAEVGYATVCGLNPNGKNNLAVRDCPRRNCYENYSLLPNDRVNIVKIVGDHAYVIANNGAKGWSRMRYLCPD